MSYADLISAIVQIAGTGAGIGSSFANRNNTSVTSQATTSQEFPADTRRLIQSTEFPLLADFLGQEASTTSPFLRGADSSPFVNQQYGQAAPAQALAAGRRGAKDLGIADMGSMNEEIGGLAPQLMSALRNLTLARGAQTQSVVPQGYGNFLAPASFSRQESTKQFNPFQTGHDLAFGLTGIAGGNTS